mmetsp:Transcript_3030/g.9131  ORF Transcript_3030/g.9131 Transcript_3030/m.9131 type:complete len:232 (-) Transcript_3030:51-746(-)
MTRTLTISSRGWCPLSLTLGTTTRTFEEESLSFATVSLERWCRGPAPSSRTLLARRTPTGCGRWRAGEGSHWRCGSRRTPPGARTRGSWRPLGSCLAKGPRPFRPRCSWRRTGSTPGWRGYRPSALRSRSAVLGGDTSCDSPPRPRMALMTMRSSAQTSPNACGSPSCTGRLGGLSTLRRCSDACRRTSGTWTPRSWRCGSGRCVWARFWHPTNRFPSCSPLCRGADTSEN